MKLIGNKCDCWESSAQNKRRSLLLYHCNQVRMNVGGQILWNVTPICETSQVYYMMGRRSWKTFWATIVKDRSFRLVHWLSIAQFLRKTSQEPIWKESLTWIVPRIRSLRGGEFGRVTYWLQDLEEVETMDASEIYSKRLNAKEVIFLQRRIYFSNRRWTSQNTRRRSGTENIHFDIMIFFGESEGSLPQPQDSFLDAGEVINDFWSMSGRFQKPPSCWTRGKLYSPGEVSFLIPLKYIDVSRTIRTNLDVKQEKRVYDSWNIDGSRDLFDPWTRFTQFTLLNEEFPDGYMWYGVRLTRKQLTSRPDHVWPELWKSIGKNAKLKEKQKWSEERIYFDNARKLRGIFFIYPEEKEFKETIKNARKKLETSVALAMPFQVWDAVSVSPKKNGRCSQIIENSRIGVSRHLDSSTTTQMAKIMHGPVWKTQSFFL